MPRLNSFSDFNRLAAQPASVADSEALFWDGNGIAARALLEAAAADGDFAAAFALARRLLVGRQVEFAPSRAIELFKSCIKQDQPDAVAQMATLHATGAWVAKDWGQACALLLRAAELGSLFARGQVLALCDEAAIPDVSPGPDAPAEVWRRLFSTIDFAGLIAASAREAVLESPRIRVAQAAASARICDWLVTKGLGKFQASMMFDGQKSAFDAARTCSDFKFDIVEGDCVLAALRDRISALTTIPTPCFEPPQIFHYATGQEIKAHYDSLRAGGQPYGQDGSYAGDRIVTFLLYLNDDYEGGELVFPKAGFRHRGRKGDGVFFASVGLDGQVDRQSLHAALPVTCGEKYILSQWIHDRPFAA